MDALSKVLSQIRLEGAVFLTAELTEPWALTTPTGQQACQHLMPRAEHLILFHWVSEGKCFVEVNGDCQVARAGQMILLPHGNQHRLASDMNTRPTKVEDALKGLPEPVDLPRIRQGGGGDACVLLCGFLACNPISAQPLLNSLPSLLVSTVPAALTGSLNWVVATLEQQGGATSGLEALLAKASELVFVQVVRDYLQSLPADHPGWLSSLNDPVVAKALIEMHGDLSRNWDLDQLASTTNASRSVIDERFRTYLGCSPIRYLMRARIRMAADLIRNTSRPLGQIATDVGYQSQAAFSRAFQRELGVAPSWHRKLGLATPV